MAAGSTPGHDRFRHGVMDVETDAEQVVADVNEESSMASWAQRVSRVMVSILAVSKGGRSILLGARCVGRVRGHATPHGSGCGVAESQEGCYRGVSRVRQGAAGQVGHIWRAGASTPRTAPLARTFQAQLNSACNCMG